MSALLQMHIVLEVWRYVQTYFDVTEKAKFDMLPCSELHSLHVSPVVR